jgi:hypothetical protein
MDFYDLRPIMKIRNFISMCLFLFSCSGLKSQTETSTAIVYFRIQLNAFSKPVDKSIVGNEFNLRAEEITEEQHNGLFKYLIGRFKALEEAKKIISESNSMKGKVFIIGYSDGVRIDLDEAIRLSTNSD